MKTANFWGIAALVAVMGLLLAGCDDGGGGHTHQWGEWEVTKAANCTETGSRYRVCADDSTHTETEVIPIDSYAHDYRYVANSGTAPTCEADGEGDEVCSYNQGHKREGVTIPKHGHNYIWETSTPATCADEGEEEGICSHDDTHTTTRSTDKDPSAHDWETLEGTSPTCTVAGSGVIKCKICEEEETGELKPLGHDHGAWHITLAAKCEETGTRELRCTRDDFILETEVIAAHGHDNGAWHETKAATFVEPGTKELRCTRDNAVLDTGTIPNLPITTTANWTTALSQLNGKTGEYTLTVSGDVGVAGFGEYNNTFGTTATGSLSVTLKGNGKLFLTSQGSIFRIGANQTLIIDSEDLVLEGLKSGQNGATQNNSTSTVYVGTGGTFTMNGGKILGNSSTYSYGGGVYNAGIFTMNGGEISGNTVLLSGAGVYNDNGTFRMVNGIIYGTDTYESLSNRANHGHAFGYNYNSGTSISEYGIFNGGTWVKTDNLGDLNTNNTIIVVNGVLQQFNAPEPITLSGTVTVTGTSELPRMANIEVRNSNFDYLGGAMAFGENDWDGTVWTWSAKMVPFETNTELRVQVRIMYENPQRDFSDDITVMVKDTDVSNIDFTLVFE